MHSEVAQLRRNRAALCHRRSSLGRAFRLHRQMRCRNIASGFSPAAPSFTYLQHGPLCQHAEEFDGVVTVDLKSADEAAVVAIHFTERLGATTTTSDLGKAPVVGAHELEDKPLPCGEGWRSHSHSRGRMRVIQHRLPFSKQGQQRPGQHRGNQRHDDEHGEDAR
jgi:hypothetical protein